MKCEVIFRNVEKSPFLCKHVEDKLSREVFERFTDLSNARVVFSKEGNLIAVRCCLYDRAGATLLIYDAKEDAYSAADLVIEKLAMVLKRRNGRKWEISQKQRDRYWQEPLRA